jgi:DNA-binding GntR family transcriptional regulator
MPIPGELGGTGREALRHHSLPRTAADWIATHIISGDIKPGEKLTEVGLAERIGVSRSPVREALRALSRDGLIIVEERRGARVGRLDATDAADLYACRLLIEPRCAALAAAALTGATAASLEATFRRMAAAVGNGDRVEYVDALKDYNATALTACPNPVLVGFAQSSWRSSLRYWDLLVRGSGNYLADSLARNEHLHVAICNRAQAETERAATEILEHGRDELLRILAHLGAGKAPAQQPAQKGRRDGGAR